MAKLSSRVLDVTIRCTMARTETHIDRIGLNAVIEEATKAYIKVLRQNGLPVEITNYAGDYFYRSSNGAIAGKLVRKLVGPIRRTG